MRWQASKMQNFQAPGCVQDIKLVSTVLGETSSSVLAYKNTFKRVLVQFHAVKNKNTSVCTMARNWSVQHQTVERVSMCQKIRLVQVQVLLDMHTEVDLN